MIERQGSVLAEIKLGGVRDVPVLYIERSMREAKGPYGSSACSLAALVQQKSTNKTLCTQFYLTRNPTLLSFVPFLVLYQQIIGRGEEELAQISSARFSLC
jgi:hypothetical protein